MKPVFTKIQEDVQMDVFAVRVIDLPNFSTEFHFHKECQMVYVEESEGKRIIGDSVEIFSSGELILLGPDIPHVWYNDRRYFEKGEQETHARSLALFFDPDKLAAVMELFGEGKHMTALLKKMRRGMKFSGKTKEELKRLMHHIATQQGMPRLITFVRILEVLTRTR